MFAQPTPTTHWWWPATIAGLGIMAALAALMATLLLTTVIGDQSTGGCVSDGTAGFTAEQTTNVQTITSVVQNRLLPERAAVIAVTAALVESGLRNVAAGDRDSVGLFQERPSQGWGSPEDILNPAYATGKFLDHLVTIPNWPALPPGVAEQDVERSAHPERYAPKEPVATQLVTKFWPHLDAAIGPECVDQGRADTPSTSVALPAGFTLPADPRQAAAVSFAIAQIGKPYVWGAKGPNAFDCSGLVQAAWAAAGVALNSGTTDQVHDGIAVPDLALVQPGDLLFTPGSLGSPAHPRHVGIYIGDGLLINAYDSKTGVIVQRLSGWASQIVAIRRPTGSAAGGSP